MNREWFKISFRSKYVGNERSHHQLIMGITVIFVSKDTISNHVRVEELVYLQKFGYDSFVLCSVRDCYEHFAANRYETRGIPFI